MAIVTRLMVRDLALAVPGRRLLDGLSLDAAPGECVAIVGPSGSGKTSLLNCLAGITLPTTGTVRIDDTELTRLSLAGRSAYRLRRIGMVFQFGELLPELTVVENVALPARLLGVARDEAEASASSWLGRVGLAGWEGAHPDVLSGGEVQRVGVARALARTPTLVIADEPTGMLDEATAVQVNDLLLSAAREFGATVVVATHDSQVAGAADRVLVLRDGALTAFSAGISSLAVPTRGGPS